MKRKHYTILLLSPDSDHFRRLRISSPLVWAAGSLVVVLLVTALAVPQILSRMGDQDQARERLESENHSLRTRGSELEQDLGLIASQLNSFEAQTQRLAEELGVEDLPSNQPAVGGDSGLAGVSGIDQELGALRTRAVDLDQSLAELDRVFQERIRLLQSTPSILPVEGWFSHGFGWRNDPWTGSREFHKGIDIVADVGVDVTASADGVVTHAGRNGGYGKTIDISHGFGYVTRYAHLSEILVRPGQRLRRGELLGRVGSTGRSTGPHLHYEVFRDSRRVNPWKYLGQRGR